MFAKIKMTCALLFLLAGFTANAQPVFSITTNPVDSTTMGTVQYLDVMEPSTYLVNHTSIPRKLKWQLLTDSTSLAPDWVFWGIADNYLVRAPNSSVFQHAIMTTDTIQPGDSSILKLLVWVPATSPNGSNGIIKIKVFDSLPTQVDTAVFRICKGTGCTYPPIYGPGGHTGNHDIAAGNGSFSLYPNPATDKVYIRMPDAQPQTTDLRVAVYDHTGRLLLQQHTRSAVDLGNVPPGIYLLRLYQGKQYLGSKKITRR